MREGVEVEVAEVRKMWVQRGWVLLCRHERRRYAIGGGGIARAKQVLNPGT